MLIAETILSKNNLKQLFPPPLWGRIKVGGFIPLLTPTLTLPHQGEGVLRGNSNIFI